MRVMIVEDQTMIRSLLESYFRAEDGYRITASLPGAKQAVEVCRTNSVDLILMDVQTENRENGLTAVRQIKAIQPKIKIIVVTSLIDCAVLDEAKRAGADSLWYKDSTQKRLMDVVRQTMAGEHSLFDVIQKRIQCCSDGLGFTCSNGVKQFNISSKKKHDIRLFSCGEQQIFFVIESNGSMVV